MPRLASSARRAALAGLIAGMLAVAGCGSDDEKQATNGKDKPAGTATPKPANGY